MGTIFTGIRKGDAVLATLLTALGVLLMVENIQAGPGSDVRVDSQSWLMIPVFAAGTLPILWRRRNLPVVYGVTVAALAVHVLAFDWVVRCGAGLPLAFALAYASGRLTIGRTSVLGLLASVVVQVLVLVEDSAAGLVILPVTAVMGAAAWGVGVWLRRRSATRSVAETTGAVASYA
jgi:hypothetical protein